MQNRRNCFEASLFDACGWVGSPAVYYLLVAVNQDKLPLHSIGVF